METTLKEFLNVIDANQRIYDILIDCKISSVSTKDNNLIIKIDASKLFNIVDYKFIEESFKNTQLYGLNVVIIFEIENAILDINAIKNYFNYFILNSKIDAFKNIARNYQIELEGTVINFSVTNHMYNMLVKEFNDLKYDMLRAGFKNEINFNILNINTDNIIENENKNLIDDNINNLPLNNSYDDINQFSKKLSFCESIDDISPNDFNVVFTATVFEIEVKITKNGKTMANISASDGGNSIRITCFENKNLSVDFIKNIKVDLSYTFRGDYKYDDYRRDYIFFARKIVKAEDKNEQLIDDEPIKRVELHLHSNMSAMDGVNQITSYIELASKLGHKAIALTDHGVVQAFPKAQTEAKHNKIKMIYGMEGYMIDKIKSPIINPTDCDLKTATYVLLDLETTGLSPERDYIIEFGAIKVCNGLVLDTLHLFIKTDHSLSPFTTKLTGITNAMLEREGINITDALSKIIDFCKDTIFVAHNAKFDYNFLNSNLIKYGFDVLKNPVIDTLNLARILYPELNTYNLGSLSRNLNIDYQEEIAHRADYDADVLRKVFDSMTKDLFNHALNHQDINKIEVDNPYRKMFSYHINILVKNQIGLKNLFRIVSISHINYFYQIPRIPREELIKNREGLLFGTACPNGEVFELAMTGTYQELEKAIDFYDFVEVHPLENYHYLIDTERINEPNLKLVINKIVEVAKKLGKLIVATGDVHNLRPEDVFYRDIYVNTLAVGNSKHPLNDYKNRIKHIPNNYYRTTKEMLNDMSYLGEDDAYEFTVTNPNIIASMIENVYPIKERLFAPSIEDSDEKLKELVYSNAYKKYGKTLPEIIEKRLEKELNSIIKHKFSVIYYSAYLIVKRSLDQNYLVGSRGSVGSSLVATMAEITEVNPLPPHYICSHCHHFELVDNCLDGYDLPIKNCPDCNHQMSGDGHNIPFETFLGFDGDKVPDIDLNFSGEYHEKAHEHTKELFGENNVFRAGTISTIADKKAFGYVKAYAEKKNLNFSNAHLHYLSKKCKDVKLTTGQHPGGIIVVPNGMDILDFTPIQYPADKVDDWKTTHIDFKSLHDTVLKLDLLGHVDPTALRMLYDLTGINPKDINLCDPSIVKLFNSLEPLGLKSGQVPNWDIGSAGIPEFGTYFARDLVKDVKPKSIAELIQISGLSHGENVWHGNSRDIFLTQNLPLVDIICCRDDIMTNLIKKGLDMKLAFEIMESVRKGKGLKTAHINALREVNIPDWYIQSCSKIKYLFPKAHATAYVMMAARIAWYKIYYPLEFYATFFTHRVTDYEIETLIAGRQAIVSRLEQLLNSKEKLTDKEQSLIKTFEIAMEMVERGYYFANISLSKSGIKDFKIEGKSLIPPFISIAGLGQSVAESIIEQREISDFKSKEDLLRRTKITKTILEFLVKIDALEGINEESQLSFVFD